MTREEALAKLRSPEFQRKAGEVLRKALEEAKLERKAVRLTRQEMAERQITI